MGFTSGGYIMQRGLGRAQFRKSETVASRLSHCDHFYGNRFFQPSGLSSSCLSFVVLAIGGVFTPVLAKHSKNFSLQDSLSIGVDRMQRNFEPMRRQVEALRTSQLSDEAAKLIIYRAFIER